MPSNRLKPAVKSEPASSADALPPWFPLVLAGVDSLDFGTVQIVVHNSRVVQVERLERHRFDIPQATGEMATKKV